MWQTGQIECQHKALRGFFGRISKRGFKGAGYMSLSVTKLLKAELWKRYGTYEHPSEWDGLLNNDPSGGKMSQRFWEYFKAIELLDLNADSVVLDIGGGSPEEGIGAGFFSLLLSNLVGQIIVLDLNPYDSQLLPNNVEFKQGSISADSLKYQIIDNPHITHVSCISVFEHMEPSLREGLVDAINNHFTGNVFVSTFEYHSREMFFPYQLNTKTVSSLFKPFTNFYLSDFESSPIHCENSYQDLTKSNPEQDQIPRWYPAAIKFERI
jgi:hypothetical protein